MKVAIDSLFKSNMVSWFNFENRGRACVLYGLLFIMRMERFCNLKRGCKREDLLFAQKICNS